MGKNGGQLWIGAINHMEKGNTESRLKDDGYDDNGDTVTHFNITAKRIRTEGQKTKTTHEAS